MALYEFFEISRLEASHKPVIFCQNGELQRICDAAERVLAATGRHYQRGGLIVVVSTDPGTKKTTVIALPLQGLHHELAGLVNWERYDKRSKAWVVCDPPDKHIGVLHAATSYPHMPVLNGIARQPFLRADGSLMRDVGYDPDSGMFGVFDAGQFNIPGKPTKQQAEIALAELNYLRQSRRLIAGAPQRGCLRAAKAAPIYPISTDHNAHLPFPDLGYTL